MRIEHLLEHVIADIVMLFANLKCSCPTLAVEHAKTNEVDQKAQVIADLIFEACPKTPSDHLVESLAVPPTIHIGFAKPKRAIARNAHE